MALNESEQVGREHDKHCPIAPAIAFAAKYMLRKSEM